MTANPPTLSRIDRGARFVDFGPASVPVHQRKMDDRLANWALWCRSRRVQEVAPGFTLHKSDTWDEREYGSTTTVGVDREDGARIAKGVAHLPEKMRLAVAWCYIERGRSNPRGKAAELGLSMEGLLDLIVDARQFLINRGV